MRPVTENRLPKVWQYLRDECDVPVLDGDAFARQITDRFLEARDEKWLVSFYSFLNGQEALWRPQGVYRYPPEGPLRKKAIIRCDDRRHRAPFDSVGEPLVFLPIESKPTIMSCTDPFTRKKRQRSSCTGSGWSHPTSAPEFSMKLSRCTRMTPKSRTRPTKNISQ